MKNDIFDYVYKFNKQRDLINEHDTKKEAILLLEEILELFPIDNPRQYARDFFTKKEFNYSVDSKREIADAYIDLIYIAFGSLIKLYNTCIVKDNINEYWQIRTLVETAIENVCKANELKIGNMDEHGKYIKSSDFTPPFIPITVNECYDTED